MYDFDQVQVVERGSIRTLEKETWLSLSAVERIEQILSQEVLFLRGGRVIPAMQAFQPEPARR